MITYPTKRSTPDSEKKDLGHGETNHTIDSYYLYCRVLPPAQTDTSQRGLFSDLDDLRESVVHQ